MMKQNVLLCSLFLLGSHPVPAQQAAQPPRKNTAQITVNQVYKQGLAALKKGDYDTAEQNFRRVLKAQPRHAHARHQLLNLVRRKPEIARHQRVQALKAVILPKVQFTDVTLDEAVQGLSRLIADAAGDTPNIVSNIFLKDPGNRLKNRPLPELRLTKVPATTAIKYLCEAAGLRADYQKHAIVLQATDGPTQAQESQAEEKLAGETSEATEKSAELE